MTDNPIAELTSEQEIPCLLLPLLDGTLLVPTVTVAEMAPLKPLKDAPDTPDWFLGFYEWRDIQVPVLSYEVLNGAASSPLNPEGRIAVMNNTGVSDQINFVAIATQGIPRLSRVGPNDIQENPDQTKRAVDLMQVKVGLEEFTIPDIAALETAYLGVAG